MLTNRVRSGRWLKITLGLVAQLTLCAVFVQAEEPETKRRLLPLPLRSEPKTLGGQQYWNDELFFHQWRIQRHVSKGTHRLLDEQDRRHAEGTFAECQEKLEQIKREKSLPPMQGKVVIVLHGLFKTRSSMDDVSKYLAEKGGYTVLNISYSSTRADIGANAKSLASIVEHLEGVEEIDFVVHSLGSLIVRHYWGDQTDPDNGRKPDPRIKRIVMSGPPNHGARRAELWAESKLFRDMYEFVVGDTADKLAHGFAKLESRLAIPTCEFAIVAGGKGDAEGWHEKVPGDDDGTVAVEEARLIGACDFVVLPLKHGALRTDPMVMEYTLRFLQNGYLVAPDKRQPILAEKIVAEKVGAEAPVVKIVLPMK
jgi:pimeloyl-ACP methyl ester carboxylesterase